MFPFFFQEPVIVVEQPSDIGQRLYSAGNGLKGEFTMYTPHEDQTDDTPTIMASGKEVYDGAIATSDYSMPLGTKVYMPSLNKVFIVEDRMNRRYSPDRYGIVVFDILNLDEEGLSLAKQWGRRKLDYVIIGHDGRKETKVETKQ